MKYLQSGKKQKKHQFLKKGNKHVCGNYRGVSVTSSIGRLYGRIMTTRIEKELEHMEEQSGFTAGRSCIDNLFCIQLILEKRKMCGREIHLLFVDLEKAYDSVPISKLFEMLEKNCHPKIKKKRLEERH